MRWLSIFHRALFFFTVAFQNFSSVHFVASIHWKASESERQLCVLYIHYPAWAKRWLKHAIHSHSLFDSRSNETPVSFTEGSSENNVCIAEVHHIPPKSPGKSGYGDFLPHQMALNNS